MLDFLTFFLKLGKLYAPVVPLLEEKLRKEKQPKIFDLASGGAGPIESLLSEVKTPNVRVLLSDLYPNPESWNALRARFPETIRGARQSVDALHLPKAEGVVFTMFSALHHFDEDGLKSLLRETAASKNAALFCDGGGNRLALLCGVFGLMPVLFLFASPFIRPLRWSRLLLTYLLPLVPLCTLWDGAVSVLRLHSLHTLRRLAGESSTEDYQWKAGKRKKFPGVYVYYLEGKSEVEIQK